MAKTKSRARRTHKTRRKETVFSCVIPVRELNDPGLSDLIDSIRAQDFDQDKIEILPITEGDSEQAKGIGIRKAKGEIIGMFCADNVITTKKLFRSVKDLFDLQPWVSAAYSRTYHYSKSDNSLNRYFALIGGNDPVCYYLGKNDRWPQVFSLRKTSDYPSSYGCNGFFYRSELIKNTNLDHYYPMDNALDVPGEFMPFHSGAIWHRTTDGNLLKFLIRRYKYARDLYCDRQDRRWKMVGNKNDKIGLMWFCGLSLTLLPTLLLSIRGFRKIPDVAWFWHPIVCFTFTLMYMVLSCRNILKWGSLFQRSSATKALRHV